MGRRGAPVPTEDRLREIRARFAEILTCATVSAVKRVPASPYAVNAVPASHEIHVRLKYALPRPGLTDSHDLWLVDEWLCNNGHKSASSAIWLAVDEKGVYFWFLDRVVNAEEARRG